MWKKIKKVTLVVTLLIIGIILSYVWYGFRFPDPFYFSRYSIFDKLFYLWLPRIILPIIYIVLILLILIKNKKIVQNITVTIIMILLLALIAWPVLEISYSRRSQLRNKLLSEKYHPFLQLNPPPVSRLNSLANKGAIKIFCLGGSTTEFDDSKGNSWPQMLEKELRMIFNSDSIYVFNFGRQWYTTLHSLINYEINLRQYKPDIVILMHNINDLLQNADFSYLSKGKFREDYGHFMGPTVNIFKNNGLFDFYQTKINQMWNYKQRIVFEQDSFPGLVPFTRNINTLIDLALMDSAKIILMTQPNILTDYMEEEVKKVCQMVNYEAVGEEKQWGYHTAYSGMNQYNQRIKAIAEKRGIFFIDLDKYIPKSLVYFTDEVHYTDTTFKTISTILASEFIRMNLIYSSN